MKSFRNLFMTLCAAFILWQVAANPPKKEEVAAQEVPPILMEQFENFLKG